MTAIAIRLGRCSATCAQDRRSEIGPSSKPFRGSNQLRSWSSSQFAWLRTCSRVFLWASTAVYFLDGFRNDNNVGFWQEQLRDPAASLSTHQVFWGPTAVESCKPSVVRIRHSFGTFFRSTICLVLKDSLLATPWILLYMKLIRSLLHMSGTRSCTIRKTHARSSCIFKQKLLSDHYTGCSFCFYLFIYFSWRFWLQS